MLHRATVTDLDSATQPGEQYTIVAAFTGRRAEDQATAWIDRQNAADVERGRYAIDVETNPEAIGRALARKLVQR